MDHELISVATREEAMEVCERLQAFNVSMVGDYRFDPVWLVHRGPEGAIVGGAVGEVVFGWLNISVLWVAEAYRKTGLGSALLVAAEQAAVKVGARYAHLDTFEWQAEGFYIKHGYSVFARLDDFPAGKQRIFMRKALM